MQRKRRMLPFPLGEGYGEVRQYKRMVGCPEPGEPLIRNTNNLGTLQGSQVTDSETHRWPPNPGNTADLGGDFFTQKKYYVGKPTNISASVKGSVVDSCLLRDDYYSGPIWPRPPASLGFPPAQISSESELIKLGTEAIARSEPTNALINLATFLAELVREGLPRLPFTDWKEATRKYRDMKQDLIRGGAHHGSDQWLNYQFGWAPVANEMASTAARLLDAERVIAQYERDAGRVVRRRWEFPEKRELNIAAFNDFSSGYYSPSSAWLSRPGRSFTVQQTDEVTMKTWFSGAFTYHLPHDWRLGGTNALSNISSLVGVVPDPETIWNLVPWSWATDWFSSAGDALSNLSSWISDGLVMRYGYLMQHTVAKRTYTLMEPRPLKGMSSDVSSSISLVTETKLRRKANPYGFGISWDSLTATQQAILAALGISRGPRK